MNTNPDETVLARWLEDELEGAELAAFEQTISGRADLHAQQTVVRAMRKDLAELIPAVEEPAYPDFFNSRVGKSIREQAARPAASRAGRRSWENWWMPATAVAGMAAAFWLGTKTTDRAELAGSPPPARPVVAQPGIYTPERGVDAEWFSSDDAGATVIVLKGLDAIPDNMDFSQTVGLQTGEQGTAGMATTTEGGVRQ
ncbi:MAG: hypothetical protein K9N23_21095 [Akkermansiaceae bacterium]|nr:hypothetical protein [Akkermansiaceae bacterium]